MEKIKQYFSDNRYTFISGGAAIFVILIVYFCFDIIPFGDKTIYRMDLYHQYGPLFTEFYDRIVSGESLTYSWNAGLGLPFIGNFYNYLSSPLSIIILIFGHENTFEAVATLIAMKAVLSSMSMSNYLTKSQKVNSPIVCAFGIMYAFSGYFIAYYWNVMWLDAMYILPFVILGIERIIDKGKIGTYLVSLTYCIFANYYIGYMICIFSCIYFLYYYACNFSRFKAIREQYVYDSFFDSLKNMYLFNSAFRFAFASICAGLILAFMLVPVAFVLSSSSATKGTFPTEFKFYFNIFDFLSNHIASLEPTIRSSGDVVLPNVYCGILTVLLIPLYIYSKKISSVEKIASVLLLCIMYFSFNINYANFVWHGFHFPNDLPYRQSFIYSFLLVVLAFKAVKNIEFSDRKAIITSGIGLTAFIIITQKVTATNVNDTSVYLSIAFVFLFTIILGLLQSKKSQAFALSIMIACSATAETVAASTEHYMANQTKGSFTIDYKDFKEIQSTVHSNEQSLFFREETTRSRARMDPCWYDYNGVSVFSSMAYEKMANLQKDLGMYGNKINSYTYNPQTPIYNSIFSLNYVYDKYGAIGENTYYSQVANNDTFTAYKNNYTLNIAYPVSNNVETYNSALANNPVEAQELLFEATTGISNVFNRIYDYQILCSNIMTISDEEKELEAFRFTKQDSSFKAAGTILIKAPEDGNVYVYLSSRNVGNVVVYSPVIQTTMTVTDGYILDLGSHTAGDEISIEIPLKDDVSYAQIEFCAFTIDQEKFIDGYNRLNQGQLEYDCFDDDYISGSFTANENEVLLTSIPYDKGWNVFIDGEKVSNDRILQVSDALLAIKVSAGNHKVEFKYKIPYQVECITFSAIFTILLLLLWILKSRKLLFFKNLNENLWERTKFDLISQVDEVNEDAQNDVLNSTQEVERKIEEIEIINSDKKEN